MASTSSILVVLLAVALLGAAVMLLRSRDGHPWPAILVASVTSAVCFTVGGGSGADPSGPTIATVMGSVVGLVAVVAAALALVPRRAPDVAPSRTPLLLCAGATAFGAVGLVLNQLVA